MEAEIGGGSGRFCAGGVPGFLVKGKGLVQSREWEVGDWRWDGDLFVARPLSGVPAGRQFLPVSGGEGSSEGSDEGKGEVEKRRRFQEEGQEVEGGGFLALKLGEQVYPVGEANGVDGRNCKRSKVQGGGTGTSSSAGRPACQVEGCRVDLSSAKDYHRRHKVCEVHAKASMVRVGGIVQRFCQQCSRFHVLQEFDEGKRSCRRRLAGHNIRRRKTHPENVVGANSLDVDRATGYILISLLRILSNLHSNPTDHAKDQDLLSHLLSNLASAAGKCDIQGLLGKQSSQTLQNGGGPLETSPQKSSAAVPTSAANVTAQGSPLPINLNEVGACSNGVHDLNVRGIDLSAVVMPDGMQQNVFADRIGSGDTEQADAWQKDKGEKVKLNDFDLNSVYHESEEYMVSPVCHISPPFPKFGAGSPDYPSWMVQESNQTSPPQTSIHSDSTSTLSPSSSNGEGQNRTDRIILKLFDKEPHDLPLSLRGQILEWLQNSPTDMESYIRPGCIVLTLYIRLQQCVWDELCNSLSVHLKKLLDTSDDLFWRSGWIYARVQNQMAFINNGQVVLDSPFPINFSNRPRIVTISPLAVTKSQQATFRIKGFNLLHPASRWFCAFEGNYLAQESVFSAADACGSSGEGIQNFSFSCSFPDASGRGFIEVEDDGLSSCFFPFIVAEQDMCSEICMLEDTFEVAEFDNDKEEADNLKNKAEALEFLHELGWILRRSQAIFKMDHSISSTCSFTHLRFKRLLEFSINRDWCAVVKKLLDILFDGRVVGEEQSSSKFVVSELCLLHVAVSRKCRPMVELLLRYVPPRTSSKTEAQHNEYGSNDYLFRPDLAGPADVTPLHIAASTGGAETIVDALINDPRMVGPEAWKRVKDKAGLTPEDYALVRGYTAYNQLVQQKVDEKCKSAHLILDIASGLIGPNKSFKQTPRHDEVSGMQIDSNRKQPCKLCAQQLRYRNTRSSLVYRPVVLSMVAIAAVCVCVALIFKGPPVLLGFPPFRWELLGYGPI
ncbi:squamosa promoter-binding-like protein 1 [Nymphaea colorata]|nr:squamosa promoter-binding-like protein 1 [Nymphaea colorata]